MSMNLSAESISVLSWNILGPATQDVDHFGFIKNDYGRLGKNLKLIREYQPDVLCLQEVDLTALHFLNNHLLGDYFQGAYQSKGTHGGAVLYFKRSMFELQSVLNAPLDSGEHLLPGAIACAVVQHQQSHKTMLIGSVHINKSSGRRASQSGVQQIKDLVHAWGDIMPDNIVIAGDFNTLYSEIIDTTVPLLNELTHKNFKMYRHISFTTSKLRGGFSSVDHVLFTGFTVDHKESRVGDGSYTYDQIANALTTLYHLPFRLIHEVVPSDHLPVYVTLRLSNEPVVAQSNSAVQISKFVKK